MKHYVSDLVVLVPDKNMEASVRGLLVRPQALDIRPIQSDIYVHPERDPGCLLRGHDFLRSMVARYTHALIMFDRAGSGQESQSRQELEHTVVANLSGSGWGDRATAIILDPELEIWIWSDSPEVDRCLGWESRQPDVRSWLVHQGMWDQDAVKPSDPKAATETVLRQVRKPRSSAIYMQLAQRVSFWRCMDPAFQKFKNTLQNWFPPVPNHRNWKGPLP